MGIGFIIKETPFGHTAVVLWLTQLYVSSVMHSFAIGLIAL